MVSAENKYSVATPPSLPLAEGEQATSYLTAVIDSLEDELLVIDTNYRIIGANKTLLLHHGKLRRQDVIGQYCYDITHGPPDLCQPPHSECPLRIALETGKPSRARHKHVYYVRGEKRERYLDIIASPIIDSQGKVTAVTELMRDVTEAKLAEDKIAQANQYLSALNTIAMALSRSLDLDTVLNSALDKTLEIMHGKIGGILLLDEEKQTLCYRVHRGLSQTYVGEMCLYLGEGIAGRVAQTGEAILVEDISKDPRATKPRIIAAEGLRAFASVPLRAKEKIVGVLNIASSESHKFSVDDVRLLESIAAQVAIATENARLHHQVQNQDKIRGELLSEIFSIQEEERRRIARELHDETSQSVASLAANLEVATATLPTGADEAKATLRKVQALSINILDELHRLIYELRPSLLDDLGLVAATRWLADNILAPAGVNVEFKTAGHQRRLPPGLETCLFRVIQESINNIVRHAQAKNATVMLNFQKSAITVNISDNGSGFDVAEAISTRDRPRGLGLLGMKERVALMNGTLSMRSHPGSGTEIEAVIPLSKKGANK